MKCNSMIKILAIVVMINVCTNISIAQTAPKAKAAAAKAGSKAGKSKALAASTGDQTKSTAGETSASTTSTTPAAPSAPEAPKPAPPPGPAYVDPDASFVTGYRSDIKSCQDSIEKLKTAQGKFIGECSSAGVGKTIAVCSEKLAECAEQQDDEEPLDVSNFSNPALGISATSAGGRCSQYSYTDYKNELKDLEQLKNQAETDAQKADKDKLKDDEDYSKDKKRILEEFAKGEKTFDSLTEEKKKERLKIPAERKKIETDLKDQLVQLNSAILDRQGKKSEEILNRASQVEDYKLQLLECDSQAQKLMTNPDANTSSSLSSRLAGSLNGAANKDGSKKKKAQTYWTICVNKVLSTRKTQSVAFDNKIANLDDSLAVAAQKMKTIQENLQLLSQTAALEDQAQASLDEKEKKAFLTEQQQKIAEMTELDNNMKKKTAKNNEIISKATNKVTEKSNNLDKHRAEKPASRGSKARSDADGALETALTTSCQATCSEITIPDPVLLKDKGSAERVRKLKEQCTTAENQIKKKGRSTTSGSPSETSSTK
jgi:hypothetical protein